MFCESDINFQTISLQIFEKVITLARVYFYWVDLHVYTCLIIASDLLRSPCHLYCPRDFPTIAERPSGLLGVVFWFIC